jgi:solute carrier family 25 (mitochondrial carnitine/acylcarnitine transporter), member 20/29
VPFLAGGVAGVFGWFFTFPLDTIKTRIQGSGLLDDAYKPYNPYATTWDAMKNSYYDDGVIGFYQGLGPTLIRAVPVNMFIFGVHRAVVTALS